MATLLLAGLGNAIGGALLPAGISAFGQTIAGAAIGQAIGATVGRAIDQSLFGSTQTTTGPRLDGLEVQKSAEGSPLPVVVGRAKIAGQVIWATRLKEATTTTTQGGKGGGSEVQSTEYSYFASFAVALTDCSTGPLRHFGRVWADGKLLDMTGLTVRFYKGTETQTPDALMVAKDGLAPAYRGVSYVVFDGLPLADYGRRIPNLTFEIWGQSGKMEDLIQGVDLIPAATEFGYSPSILHKQGAAGSSVRENAFRIGPDSDWKLSLDLLENTVPNCGTVALVVSWFGTDLRAKYCEIEPRIEIKTKTMKERAWSASGLSRASANLVSYVDGRPAFGSAPDDQSVMDAIVDLKARGFRVVIYPFIMMDIPDGNTLTTRTGGTGQATYPWRGRIGQASADGTVASQVTAFTGTAAVANFSTGSGVPVYSGPSEWSYRRFILHMAALARNAGGVDAFLVGSELVDLTTATDAAGVYPFVSALKALAADVKSMLPAALVSYAADWSEYHSHRSGADVYFHLDSFWADSNVDFVGIDNYLPTSDWRPGSDHADFDPATGQTSPYNLDYLKSNIEGGEFWDWYYLSDADRAAQIRTPITDGAYSEEWVFRQKAIKDWWSNTHRNRPAGVRDTATTAWAASDKPVWFTEFGCPAVDLGPNQPNVFFDAGSSESALPHFSSGVRDDFAQRQYIRAMVEYWTDNGGTMLDPADMFVWSWDARPWPEFPRLSEQWSDGENWRRGHWLNARAGSAPAAETIEARLSVHYGFTTAKLDLSRCFGQADGLVLSGPVSFRDMLAPFETALRLDAAEIDGVLHVSARAAAIPIADYLETDLVEVDGAPLYQITTTSREEAPRAAVVRYSDSDRDYQPGAARATIRENPGQAEAVADLALVSDLERMTATADVILRAAAGGREFAEFTLPPSSTLKPGDVFTLTPRNGTATRFIAEKITRGSDRKVRAALWSGAVFGSVGGPVRASPALVPLPSRSAVAYLMDLPLLPGVDMEDHQGMVVLVSHPWPGGVDLYRSADLETGYSLKLRSGLAGSSGETIAALPPGKPDSWSSEVLDILLYTGGLVSRPESDVLDGANALAIEHGAGLWEVVQFKSATLIAADTWRLTGLLRGQLGTEWVRSTSDLAIGARVVVLDQSAFPVEMLATDLAREFNWRAVPTTQDVLDGDIQTHAFIGAGRRPYAPAHLAGIVDGTDLDLSWIRRTRIGGDTWPDSSDVPLGEVFERYAVELGPAGSPNITATVDDAQAATLDVTGLSGTYEVRVSQVSETFGPGAAAILSLTL
jgi:GTA TIM-barrel-like domain/Putative phage tail protein